MSDEPKPSLLEYHKIEFEYMKHLATLNTGAILAYATLLEKVLVPKPSRFLSGAVLVCFVFSLLASVLEMLSICQAIKYGTATERRNMLIALVFFMAGILGVLISLM